MISKKEDFFLDLKKNVSREIKIAKEVGIFLKETEKKENSTNKKEIEIQMNSLKKEFMEAGKSVIETLENWDSVLTATDAGYKIANAA